MDSRVMELKIQKWIPLIEDQVKSGMTKNEWCDLHGISRTVFFRWQKRVREYLLDKSSSQPPQLPAPSASNGLDFVELPSAQAPTAGIEGAQCGETAQACSCPPSISIRYGGFSIDLNGKVDAQQLSAVLGVLRHAD